MGITNGQPVDETFTNPAFLDRRLDDTAVGAITLANTTHPESGATVPNIQQNINDLIQNFHFVFYSLTHQKVAYAAGVITFPENLVVASPDFMLINTINIPVANVNIADGESMYCTLSRYSALTIGYTVSANLPKGKDIFRIATRVGNGVVFYPNILIMDGTSARLGEGTQFPFVPIKEFLTKVDPNNPADYSYSMSETPVSNDAVSIFTDHLLEYDPTTAPYSISGAIVTFDPSFAPPLGVLPYATYFVNGSAGSPAPVVGAANVGTGVGVFSTNNLGTLEFFTINPGTGMTVTGTPSGIVLDSSGGSYVAQGDESTPQTVVAAAGITPSADLLQSWYVKGVAASGRVSVSANPQIAAGSTVGQRLSLANVNATDYVVFNDGTGLAMNGAWPSVGAPLYAKIEFEWSGLRWIECSRQ